VVDDASRHFDASCLRVSILLISSDQRPDCSFHSDPELAS
jgi:hypothetical protein